MGIWLFGLAESNGGNISVRLKTEFYPYFDGCQPKSKWLNLSLSLLEIGVERFLVIGTASLLRNIMISPQKNLAVIEFDKKGESYRLLWGHKTQGEPTSELPPQLLSLPDENKIEQSDVCFNPYSSHSYHRSELCYNKPEYPYFDKIVLAKS